MLRDPRTDRFLVDYSLRDQAERRPDHTAVVDGARSLTYRELDALADRWAALLAAWGVTRGDRVLLVLDNSAEVVAGYYGALRADAIPSILGTRRRTGRLLGIIERAEPRLIVTTAALRTSLDKAGALTCRVLCVDDAKAFEAAWAAVPGSTRPPSRCSIELDLATICWTSGSTGEPKGVMLTHQNVRNSTAAIAAYLEQDEHDVILSVLPLAHTYGLYQMLVTLWAGGTLVLERGFAMAFPVVRRMAELRVTGFAGVPGIFAAILALKGLEQLDLSALRYLTNAAYALPEAHLQRIRALVPRARFFAMYGQTECTRVCYLPPELANERPSSVGIPMPNEEVWIEREDGTRAGPGETGELVVRGANVMRGYWRDPEATARVLRPGQVPGEMVLRTRDLFRTDQDGYLYFVARSDDIIKTRGEKVAPCEVEQVICALPGVIECAVVGVPDPVHGIAVKAVVVRAPGANVTADDVKRVVFTELDEVAVPSAIDFVDSLPKTESGKVLKSELV